MLRIVGMQRDTNPDREFVLLQNQGALRVQLRGHVVMAEDHIDGAQPHAIHVMTDDVAIPTGKFVLLATGAGKPRWTQARDGVPVFLCYMGRLRSVWNDCGGAISVLGVQHSYMERRDMPIELV